MDEPRALPPPDSALDPAITLPNYHGNKYDLYALVAGTLGGTVLAMCVSGNFLLYCLPIAPLVLGVLALRNAPTSLDPQRTRNLAWIGIAGGGLGTLLTIVLIAIIALYFCFLAAVFANIYRSAPQN
jgi:hypothetical protein